MAQNTREAKHKVVAGSLRKEIGSGNWQVGDRLPGEHQQARRFDVSYMTMRQAITNLVDDGVLVRVRGKGTFILATDPGAKPTVRDGMVMLFPTDWLRDDPYYLPELLTGFEETMKAHGFRATFANYDVADKPGVLQQGSTIACLVVGEAEVRLIHSLRDNGYNVLAVNHYTGYRRVPCVGIDDAQGVSQAIAHLVGLGHARIGFLSGDPAHLDSADRLRGFRTAMKQYGLISSGKSGDGFTEASGYAAAIELLAQTNRPTALMCSSDLCAIGASKAAREKGLSIPDELSLIGFGDFSVAPYMHPALTTVRQPRRDLGNAAAEALIALARGDETANSRLIANLVLRESTARANHAPNAS